MSSFWNLVGFEYKKIVKRKSTIVVLSLVIVLIFTAIILNATGQDWYFAMRQDRETIHSNAGAVDEKIIREAIEQNAIMASNDENYMINDLGKFAKGEAYYKYALPYENIVKMINVIYETESSNISVTDDFKMLNLNSKNPIDTLIANDASKFYDLYRQKAVEMISERKLSLAENQKHEKMLSQVKIPFYNDYFGAYASFAVMLSGLGMTILVAITICIAPIFANEYQTQTDQIILSSKYGKSKVIIAKIFTGVSFAAVLTIIATLLYLVALFCVHGVTGYNVSIQFLNYFITYPVTMLQATLISILVLLMVCMVFSMFVMLLSSLNKSTYGVIIIAFLTIFVPVIINIPFKDRVLYQLFQLFPAKAISFSSIFSQYLFQFFGLVFTPATIYCILAVIISVILAPFCYRSFKNHQAV